MRLEQNSRELAAVRQHVVGPLERDADARPVRTVKTDMDSGNLAPERIAQRNAGDEAECRGDRRIAIGHDEEARGQVAVRCLPGPAAPSPAGRLL
jgi:hypothetical protein